MNEDGERYGDRWGWYGGVGDGDGGVEDFVVRMGYILRKRQMMAIAIHCGGQVWGPSRLAVMQ